MDRRRQTHSPKRIFSLIAGCLSEDHRSAIRAIEHDRLWEYVAAHACKLQIGGALLATLQDREIEIPASAAGQLQVYREHVIAANDYRVSCTGDTLSRLQADNVPFLLLKGAALNAVLYDQPGVRTMIDVDILIRAPDVDRVDRLLRRCGCSPGADLVRDDFYPRYYYEREYFTCHRPPVKIDLHVRPFRPLRYARTVPDEALWDRPQQTALGNLTVDIPSADNMLIHLAVHAAGHGLSELRWLYDIKMWLDRFGSRIDVKQVAAKCRTWRVALPVLRALERTSTVFGQSYRDLTEAIRPTARTGLADRLALSHAPRDAERPVTSVLVNLLCTPGLRFRLGYLKAVLFPGRSHMGQLYHRRHPGWLIAAHLVRAARSIARPLLPARPEPA